MFQGLFPTLSAVFAASAVAGTETAPPRDALDFQVKGIDGQTVDLGQWRGKVVLVVNTASKCGHTPQYAGLQKLWEQDSAKVQNSAESDRLVPAQSDRSVSDESDRSISAQSDRFWPGRIRLTQSA